MRVADQSCQPLACAGSRRRSGAVAAPQQRRPRHGASLSPAFLARLTAGAAILDAGCGSGHDARAFRDLGYAVTATEPAPALARLAAVHCGQPVEIQRFQDIDWHERFDGIWACASLLHVPLDELPEVLGRLARALRPGGVLYASFKYGHGERERSGRWFTDLDEAGLDELLFVLSELTMIETWITDDRRPGRDNERWLNALLVRLGSVPPI